jgi:hypothetical protein
VHDPKNKWSKSLIKADLKITRQGHEDRKFNISIRPSGKHFEYKVAKEKYGFVQGIKNDKFYTKFNNEKIIARDTIKKYDLTEERTRYLKRVYEYFFGLPMRLIQDTSYLLKDYKSVEFNGQKCYEISIQYEPSDKNERWDFYINKETNLVVGCKFYVKDPNTNGEYIYFSEFEDYKGILFPKTKDWYWNKDKSYFRKDKVLKFY